MLTFFIVIILNFLISGPWSGGQTVGEVSARYPTLITPADYAFAIWGFIYLGLAVYGVYQYKTGKDISVYLRVWPWLMLNGAANVAWLIAFQSEFINASLVIIAIVFITLLRAYIVLRRRIRSLSTSKRYFLQVPLSAYLAWSGVALSINFAVALMELNMPIFNDHEIFWAFAATGILTLTALTILHRLNDYTFALVSAWAIFAIGVNNMEIDSLGLISKLLAAIILIWCGIKIGAFLRNRFVTAKNTR